MHSMLTSFTIGIPRNVDRPRTERSVQDVGRRQVGLGRRHQEGVLRPREEVPPGHEQGPLSEGDVRRDPERIRDPFRPQEEAAV